MKNLFYAFGTIILILSVAVFSWWLGTKNSISKLIRPKVASPITQSIKPKPLDKYTFENLSQTKVGAGGFTIKQELKKEEEFTSSLFEFNFNSNLDGKTIKKTTGQINLPESKGTHPIVVMFRGYIDQELYTTGDGTKSAAAFFAKNDFITIAPDFLGYAGSDPQAENIFESRFQTYVTALSLLNSLDQIDNWDGENIFIWGHSNGGQIALTVAEIAGHEYPTTLWAPVSKAFPYSVLYYTDEAEDRGKLIRHELAIFEDVYNTDLYSLHDYYDKITTKVQIHQGTADDAIPIVWSDDLVANLNKVQVDTTYYKYPGNDHNLRPSWDTVVARDLDFFQNNIY